MAGLRSDAVRKKWLVKILPVPRLLSEIKKELASTSALYSRRICCGWGLLSCGKMAPRISCHLEKLSFLY